MYSRSDTGSVPVSLEEAKQYMKVTTNVDDQVITDLLETATEWAEAYTGRDTRANTWTLTLDSFSDRIELRKSPIASISSITYLVSGTPETIADTVYYLKKGTQFSEVLLKDDQSWPTDLDEVEAGIVITFVTEVPRQIDRFKSGILRHVALMYENRGDCNADTAKSSGADLIYDQFRIARI